jgi:hypothetical protein
MEKSPFLDILAKIRLFSEESVQLGLPATEAMIVDTERLLGCRLPEDMRSFFRLHNGGSVCDFSFFGSQVEGTGKMSLVSEDLVTQTAYLRDLDVTSTFDAITGIQERTGDMEIRRLWPENLIAIGRNSLGDIYVLERDTYRGIGMVNSSELGDPEMAPELYAEDYRRFLERAVEDVLTAWNFDGSIKT